MDLANIPRDFSELTLVDKDLTMFTITSLSLKKSEHVVQMVIVMKRKIQTEMLTTYLPTILLLGITYATTFFKPMYFEAVSFVVSSDWNQIMPETYILKVRVLGDRTPSIFLDFPPNFRLRTRNLLLLCENNTAAYFLPTLFNNC